MQRETERESAQKKETMLKTTERAEEKQTIAKKEKEREIYLLTRIK